MMTDPIADMLTQIRNAVRVERSHVEMPVSKVKRGLAEVLSRARGISGTGRKSTDGTRQPPADRTEVRPQRRTRHPHTIRRISKPERGDGVPMD